MTRVSSDWSVNPGAGERILRDDPRAEHYATTIVEDMRNEAIAIFETMNKHEGDLAPHTHYIEGFDTSYSRDELSAYLENSDPIWNLVEFGARPGTGERHNDHGTFVLRYRPMGRAFELAIAKAYL